MYRCMYCGKAGFYLSEDGVRLCQVHSASYSRSAVMRAKINAKLEAQLKAKGPKEAKKARHYQFHAKVDKDGRQPDNPRGNGRGRRLA